MAILSSLKTIFTADTSTFRKAVTQSMDLVDQFAAKTKTLASQMKTLGGVGSVGDRFRSPDSGQFIGATKAMEVYHSQILGLEADLEALKSGLNTVNAPLRDNGVYALMASESSIKAAESSQAMGTAVTSTLSPLQQSAMALQNIRTNAIAIQAATAPITGLQRSLMQLNLVNYRVMASVEQWDILGVMRGPGLLVVAFDKLSYHLRGIEAPMRQLQYVAQMLLVPAMMALSNMLTEVANNPAATVLSRNLAIISAQIVDRYSAGKMTGIARVAHMLGLLGQSAMGSLPAIGALSLSVTGVTFAVGSALTNAIGRGAVGLGTMVMAAYRAATGTQQLSATYASVRTSVMSAFEAFANWGNSLTKSMNESITWGNALKVGLAVLRTVRTATLGAASATAGALTAAFAGAIGVTVRLTSSLAVAAARLGGFVAARAITGIVQGLTQSFVQLGVQALQAAGKMAKSVVHFATLGLLGRRASSGIDKAAGSMRSATTAAGGFRMGLSMVAPAMGMFLALGPVVGTALAAFQGAKQGLSFAAQTEQVNVAFTTMLKSTEQATKLNEQITAFSAATPFQLPELREGAKTLLGFAVAQEQVVPTLKMLGNIAAGTGKPINELAAAYGKMKARGVADMEHLSTFMEAGALDAEAFAKQMGMTREQLFKAVENKDISFGDVQRGLIAATAAGGKFDGMIEAQSQTVNGLLSTLNDNVNITLGAIGEKLFTAFNVRGIIQGMITLTGWIRETLVPTVFAAADRIMAFFQPIGVTIFSTIMPYVTAFMEGIQTAFLFGEFVAQNWRESLIVAGTGAMLAIVRFGAIVQYTFTTVIPAVLKWFWENWRDIFQTVFDFTTTVLINIGKNVRDLFTALYEFIASGGTKPFEFAFTPLTDGFVNTIRKLPEIAAREIGPTEKTLADSFEKSSANLRKGFDQFAASRRAIPAAAAAPGATIGAVIPDDAGGAKDKKDDKKKGKSESELKALEFGSAETFKAAFGKQDDKLYKQGETANKLNAQQVKALNEISKKIGREGVDVVKKL